MLTYEITPGTGTVKVTEDKELIAKFYFVQGGFDWEVFDEWHEGDGMPLATVPTMQAAIAWVMDIDPGTFTEDDEA